MSAPYVRSDAVTDRGARRRLNEDNCLARLDLGLWMVADGVGGAQAGEVASTALREALDTIPPGLASKDMLTEIRQRVDGVHQELRAAAAARGPQVTIASTIAVLIVAHTHFACLWAGDSRIYLLHDGVLLRLTRDHSLVQAMVDAGELTEAEAEQHPNANVILRAVGAGDEKLELDKVTGEVRPGDRFLLCSDGLTKTLTEPEIAALLGGPDTAPLAELLVHAALAREARDNVTAVTVIVPAAGELETRQLGSVETMVTDGEPEPDPEQGQD